MLYLGLVDVLHLGVVVVAARAASIVSPIGVPSVTVLADDLSSYDHNHN